MKKILMLLIMISMILVGCAQNKDQEDGSDLEAVLVEPVMVKTEIVKEHLFNDTLEMPGIISPVEEVMITSRIGGDVTSINAEIGETVEKNQMLLKFDDTVYSLTLKKAKLGVESAQLALKEAKNNYENNNALYNQSAISKNTYETYEKAYKMAQIGLQSAEADYETALENFKYTTVKTPIKGVVGSKEVSEGENLNVGTRLFTVVNTEKVYVEAGISEMNVNTLSVGMTVVVTINSIPGEEFSGLITHIGPIPGEANTYPVKILINNEKNLIKTGMFATAVIRLGDEVKNLAVPKHVVQKENENFYVYVVDQDTAQKRTVEVGLQDEDYFEIKSGVSAGDEIIVSGQNIVKAGEPVKIVE